MNKYIVLLLLTACGNGLNITQKPIETGCTVSELQQSPEHPNGGAIIECKDGTTSVVVNGENGAQGTAGTVITPVTFCNSSTNYPTTFAEVGFCINGEVYGVYSQNGGFLTLLPEGYYSSNGINSNCSFTIGNNCEIIR